MVTDAVVDSVPRERIVTAARRRFESYGYRRTSIAEIARDAGIAVGTVYRYFAGKEAVFLAVVEDLNEKWLAESRRALDGPGTAADRLDRKSTRLNSSQLGISYAVFCLKKKKK